MSLEAKQNFNTQRDDLKIEGNNPIQSLILWPIHLGIKAEI
jgi:hypothetical protein